MTHRHPTWLRRRPACGWKAPDPLGLRVPAAPRSESVLAHTITVSPNWWHEALAGTSCAQESPADLGSLISRQALFALAADAADDPIAARRLMWATLSFGTGLSQRWNRQRVAGITADVERSGQLLAEAACASRISPHDAFALLQPQRRPLLRALGPSFSTKYLYFAGGGNPAHPSLILDNVVAGRLCALPSVQATGQQIPAYIDRDRHVYRDYCAALRAEAQLLSSPRRTVAADELEVALFTGPAPQRSTAA